MEFEIELLGKPCGILKIESERFSFSYLDSYLAANEVPLSVSMPLTEDSYSDDRVFPFFENLLPEGQIRQLMAEKLKTAPNNFSRLLESVGGDVAGAIRILAEPDSDSSVHIKEPEKLTKSSLGEVLARIELAPFRIDEAEKPRLSLAGAQNKLPVIMKNGDIYLTHGQPSTHIIKPPSNRFQHLIQNEFLCMRSARKAGLDTPNVGLVPFTNSDNEEHECLVVERYDRKTNENLTIRIHQEDICQVLSVPSSQKYTKDGGPGYQELFETVRKFTAPSAVYQNELLRRVLFNVLIGNNDAHAKNFSLLHTKSNIKLAPAYDLVDTEVYEELDHHFAMPIGKATKKDELSTEQFRTFEKQININISRQKKSLKVFVDTAREAIESEILELKETGYPGIQELLKPMQAAISRNHSVLKQVLD